MCPPDRPRVSLPAARSMSEQWVERSKIIRERGSGNILERSPGGGSWGVGDRTEMIPIAHFGNLLECSTPFPRSSRFAVRSFGSRGPTVESVRSRAPADDARGGWETRSSGWVGGRHPAERMAKDGVTEGAVRAVGHSMGERRGGRSKTFPGREFGKLLERYSPLQPPLPGTAPRSFPRVTLEIFRN